MKKKASRLENFTGKWNTAMIDGVESLGCVCIMDLHGVKESRASLAERLNDLDLPGEEIKPKREQTAFLDILKHMEKSGIIVKVDSTFQWITYQVNSVALDAAMTENGLTRAAISAKSVVRFYKIGRSPKGGMIESDTIGVANAIEALMDAEKDMASTNDVTGAIKRICERLGDITDLRQSGGAIFIPAPFYATAQKLEVFVESLNGDNSFTLLPVPATGNKKATVWKAVAAEVQKTFDDLEKAEKDAAEAVLDGKGKGRVDTVHASYKEAIARAQIYADFLNMNAESIVEKAKAKQAAFQRAVLMGFRDADSTPETPTESAPETI